jgi:hypothetical protein
VPKNKSAEFNKFLAENKAAGLGRMEQAREFVEKN